MTIPRLTLRSRNPRPSARRALSVATPRRAPQAIAALFLLLLCVAIPQHAAALRLFDIFGRTAGAAAQPETHPGNALTEDQAQMVENSRDAGLLTDWHFMGHYGTHPADLANSYAPERWLAQQAAKQAALRESKKKAAASSSHPETRLKSPRYELVYPEGTFVLPPSQTGRDGVFYALSCTYLTSSGDWNVYLESEAPAVVFVDGRRVLVRGPKASGTRRETIHLDSGYHLVMVKFTLQAAPFRVAILPPNSGSRRKNNTPYLHPEPGSEDLQAELR
jgi:hypothetical protein